MPIRVEAPDKTIVEFPDGTDDATINSAMAKAYGGGTKGQADQEAAPESTGAAPLKANQVLGFQKGLKVPLDNAAVALEAGARKIGLPVDQINAFLGGPSAKEAAQATKDDVAAAETRGERPGTAGQIAGGMVAAAPILAVTKNPWAAGAAIGATQSEAETLGGRAADAGFGAVTGGAGDIALRGLGTVVKPQINKMAQALLDRGVELTPGQIAGGVAHRLEDASRSMPILGDLIGNAQNRANDSFSKAALNEALAPLGLKIPKSVQAGHDAVAYTQKAISDAYDAVLPKLQVKVDPTLRQDVGNLVQLAAGMPDKYVKQFDTLLKNEVVRRFGANGTMTGNTFKEVEEILGREVKDFGTGNASPHDRRYADAVRELQSQLREAAARATPQAAELLKNINAGFGKLAIIEPAAANSPTGVVNATGLKNAVVNADKSSRKRTAASGGARLQALAKAGTGRMTQTVPDSGTATRGIVNAATGAALFGAGLKMSVNPLLATALALGAGAYTKGGGSVVRALMTQRPEFAAPLRALIERGALPAGVGSSVATTQQRNQARVPSHVE